MLGSEDCEDVVRWSADIDQHDVPDELDVGDGMRMRGDDVYDDSS